MRNSMFGLDEISYHDEGQELLCTVYSMEELTVLRSILEGAEIPYLLKERGAGGASKVIIGFSICGTDVFVPESVYEDALALISVEENGEEEPNEGSEENAGEEETEAL